MCVGTMTSPGTDSSSRPPQKPTISISGWAAAATTPPASLPAPSSAGAAALDLARPMPVFSTRGPRMADAISACSMRRGARGAAAVEQVLHGGSDPGGERVLADRPVEHQVQVDDRGGAQAAPGAGALSQVRFQERRGTAVGQRDHDRLGVEAAHTALDL